MTDWQIISDDEFGESPENEQYHSEGKARWIWLGVGIFTFLLIAGFATLEWRRTERQSAIRQDLEAAIFEEETLLYLGIPETVPIAPNTSSDWQQTYRQNTTSSSTNSPPKHIRISDVNFDGQCATVSLEMAGVPQLRAYCLGTKGWQRAPVSIEVWGKEEEVVQLINGVSLHFLSKDKNFAEKLASDLPAFFNTLSQQGLWSQLNEPLEIRFAPQELQPPLILNNNQQIILNSPWLTPYQPDTGLSGQAAVRLALGKALLHQSLPLDCVEAKTQFRVLTNWLNAPTEPTSAHELGPLNIPLAPADTVAYVLTGDVQNSQALAAVRRDGTLRTLSPLSDTRRVFPLPTLDDQATHFLFQVDVEGCAQSWFVHYTPTQGVTHRWLAPPGYTQWVWQPEQNKLILLAQQDDDPAGRMIYQTNNKVLPTAIRQSPVLQTPLGWNINKQQLVSHITGAEGYHLALFDLFSGNMEPITYYLPLQGRALSPGGQWLAYLASSINVTWPPNRLELINLSDRSSQTLMVINVGQAFWPPVWSLKADRPLVVTLTGPAKDNNSLPVPVQLVVISPKNPGNPLLTVQAAPNELFASPVFCANGDLLYRVEKGRLYRLVRQTLKGQVNTLLTSNKPFHPFACPN